MGLSDEYVYFSSLEVVNLEAGSFCSPILCVTMYENWLHAVGEQVPEGKYLALQLTFALPVSSYATMLVRELLKSTTSNIEHREMTKADESEAAAVKGKL